MQVSRDRVGIRVARLLELIDRGFGGSQKNNAGVLDPLTIDDLAVGGDVNAADRRVVALRDLRGLILHVAAQLAEPRIALRLLGVSVLVAVELARIGRRLADLIVIVAVMKLRDVGEVRLLVGLLVVRLFFLRLLVLASIATRLSGFDGCAPAFANTRIGANKAPTSRPVPKIDTTCISLSLSAIPMETSGASECSCRDPPASGSSTDP